MTTSIFTNKFSLTEYVAQDIRNLTKERVCFDIVDDISYFLESEVTSRVFGLSLSFFATLDTLFYIEQTLEKTTLSLLHNLYIIDLNNPPTDDDIFDDIKHIGTFAIAILVGSVVGVIFPRALDINVSDTTAAPTDPDKPIYETLGISKEDYESALKAQRNFDLLNTPEDFDIENNAYTPDESLPKTWEETSEDVRNLWAKAIDKNQFTSSWKEAAIENKKVFVHVLDLDNSDEGLAAKAKLVNVIYKKISSYGAPDNASNVQSWPKQSEEAYYHATQIEGLEGILKSGQVEVRHQKQFKGAFVSTCPELMYGRYVLVFRRNIERLSHLHHRSKAESVWAGFKGAIPVNKFTLAKVIVNRSNLYYAQGEEEEKAKLKKKIKNWFGSEIPIEIYKANKHAHHALDHVYPREWDEAIPPQY